MLLLPGFTSPVMGPTAAVLRRMVSSGVLAPTWSTRVNVARVLPASVAIQADTVPVALPTAGALLLQPLGTVHDTSVTPAGSTSARVTLLWALGLLWAPRKG